MRINTIIVILLITFIICNNNHHIKGVERDDKPIQLREMCKATFDAPIEEYKLITRALKTEFYYINKRKIVIFTVSTEKYEYYSYTKGSVDPLIPGKFLFTGKKVLEYTIASDKPATVTNYLFPWNTQAALPELSFGSVGDAYDASCTLTAEDKMSNLLTMIPTTRFTEYENIDPFMESFPETRNVIDDTAIGESVMLSRVDATAKKNENIFLSKTQFCHFSCKIDNTECDLLVYGTADYKSQNINDAYVIGVTGTAKLYKAVKADTVELVDACAGAGSTSYECTKPQYTVISKGTEKKLTGYYKDEKTKYLVSASPPRIPAGIYAKFPTYIYCIGEPGVQGVSNMFINSILLIVIVILMI